MGSSSTANLTPFCWVLHRNGPKRLMVDIHVAPGFARRLVAALPADWGARATSGSAVRVASRPGVLAALRTFEPQDRTLWSLLDTWDRLAGEVAPGEPSTPARDEAIRAVLASILQRCMVQK